MNRAALILASLCAASVALLAGCPLGCGGFSGEGDHVFARGGDQLITCVNTGFVLTTSGTTIEGKLTFGEGDATGIEGDNGATIFTETGDEQILGLGSGWTEVDGSYTPAELDHADVLCTDLTSRAWWSAAQ